jgi:hypothetical protein
VTPPRAWGRQVCLDELSVPLEPAGRQNDATPGAHTEVLAVVGDTHAGDAPRIGDELHDTGIRSRYHIDVEQSLQQPGDQRGACHAVVTGLVIDRRVDPGAGFCVDADVAEIRGERGDPVPPFTQPRQIERFYIQRPSAGGSSAGQFRFVIRETLGDLELQLAVCFDEVEHVRAIANKRLHQVVVHEPE